MEGGIKLNHTTEGEIFKAVMEDLIDDVEIKEIDEKYFSEESKADYVGQGDAKLFDGKPLISDSFTNCSALVTVSKRSFALSHIEPSGVRSWIGNMHDKFFPKDELTQFIYISDFRSLRIDSGWKMANVNQIDLKQGGGHPPRWAIGVDPVDAVVYVKYKKEGKKVTIGKIVLPKIYDHELHKQSGELFESLDYMPKEFREMQRYFEARNYGLSESDLFWNRLEYNKNLQQLAKETESERKIFLFQGHEFTELDNNSTEPLGKILASLCKKISDVYIVEVFDYPPDDKYQGRDGFVFVSKIRYDELYKYGWKPSKDMLQI
jgi:hypothetical protein